MCSAAARPLLRPRPCVASRRLLCAAATIRGLAAAPSPVEEASRFHAAVPGGLSWAPRSSSSTTWRSSSASSSSSSSGSPAGPRRRVYVEPEEISYSVIIESNCRDGDIRKLRNAVLFLEEMTGTSFGTNVFVFNAVIAGFARMGSSDEAMAWLTRMIAEGLAPNVVSYTAVIDGCAKVGDSASAVRWFETMRENSVVPNAVTYNAVINCHARVGDADGAQRWLSRMRQAMPPDEISYSSVLNGCANARPKRAEQAENVFREMRTAGIYPTSSTLSALERAVGKQRRDFLCSALGIDTEKAKRFRLPPQHRRAKPLIRDGS